MAMLATEDRPRALTQWKRLAARLKCVRCETIGLRLLADKPAGVNCPACGTLYRFQEGVLDLVPAEGAFSSPPEYEGFLPTFHHWTLTRRFLLRLNWGVSARKLYSLLEAAIADLTEGFCLDLPLSASTLLTPQYYAYSHLTFVAADVSWQLLRQTRQRLRALPEENVLLVRADVHTLPFRPASFAAVRCLYGLHTFADRPWALQELTAVLQPGGRFAACAYVRGERWLSDRVAGLFVKSGHFAPGATVEEFNRWFAATDLEFLDATVVGGFLLVQALRRSPSE